MVAGKIGCRGKPWPESAIQKPVVSLDGAFAAVDVFHQEVDGAERDFHRVFQRGAAIQVLRNIIFQILHVRHSDHGLLPFSALDQRIGVFGKCPLAVLQAEQNQVPADGFLFEGYAMRIEVPLGVPMQDLPRSRERKILPIDFRKIARGVAYLAITHVGEQRNHSEIIGFHGDEDFFGSDGEPAGHATIAMNVRVAREPAGRFGIFGRLDQNQRKKGQDQSLAG